MKTNHIFFILTVLAIGVFVMSPTADAKAQKKALKVKVSKKVLGGEATRLSRNLVFDGSSVESVRGGRFGSFTHLAEGTGNAGKKRLYSIPSDFSEGAAAENKEMGYRK